MTVDFAFEGGMTEDQMRLAYARAVLESVGKEVIESVQGGGDVQFENDESSDPRTYTFKVPKTKN